jgi:DnaJ like chaperone protein
MTIWSRIADFVQSVGGTVNSILSTFSRKSPAPEKSIAFTIGMIALGAKMARADGTVTVDEVIAFKQVFEVPAKDAAAVERIFNLAKQDVAGFDTYAAQVAKLFDKKALVLENVIDGLFHIAKSDGVVHQDELEYLRHVSEIFGFSGIDFQRICARHIEMEEDAFATLGIPAGSTLKDINARYRKLARDLHPDRQIAAGVPAEMVRLATERLVRINVAYAKLAKTG